MLLHHLFENDIIPKKVLAVVLVRFFRELNEAMYELMSDVESFGNELNLDTSQPDMRLMVSFPTRLGKPPAVELRKTMNALAKKHQVSSFKPRMTFDKEDAFNHWVNIAFAENLELDDAALDAAWEENKRLSVNDDQTAGRFLTVNG